MVTYPASGYVYSIYKWLFLFYPLKRYVRELLSAPLIIVISISSYAQLNTQSAKTFQLTGILLDRDTGQIVLWYPDTSGRYIKDTAYLSNGGFQFKGYIVEPSFAHLIGSDRNGNYGDFFLEGGNQTIMLKENNFDQLQMKGSESQRLYDSLNNELNKVKNKIDGIDSITNVLDSVSKHMTDVNLKKSKENLLTEFSVQRQGLTNSIRAIQINFIKQYPDSYVSVTVLSGLLIVTRHPVLAVQSLYASLSSKLKSSRAGLYCLSEIKKRAKLTSGNILSNFQANTFKGETIALDRFTNKYVLLDFWASWCVPCRKEIPELKKAYTQYRHKGLEIIAISSDDDQNNWKKAIQTDRTDSWVHVLKNKELALLFEPIQAIPQKILLDKSHKIIWSSLDDNTNSWQDVLADQVKTDSN